MLRFHTIIIVLIGSLAFGRHAAASGPLIPGHILVVDFSTDRVVDIDPATGAQTSISAGGVFVSLFGIVVEPAGTIAVLDRDAFNMPPPGAGAVLRIDPATGQQTPILVRDGLIAAEGFTLGPAGELLVSNFFGDNVIQVDPVTGVTTEVTANGLLAGPVGMVARSDGVLFIADNDGPTVIRADLATGMQALVASAGFLQGPTGIAIEPSGNLVVADANAGAVIRIVPSTGQQSIVSSGFDLPFGIAVEADGNLLVTDSALGLGRIVRVDPVSGAQTVVASGGFLSFPTGIVIVPAAPGLPGDVNGDGAVDLADSLTLTSVLIGSDTNPAHVCAADINNDGASDGGDIQPFLQALLGP